MSEHYDLLIGEGTFDAIRVEAQVVLYFAVGYDWCWRTWKSATRLSDPGGDLTREVLVMECPPFGTVYLQTKLAFCSECYCPQTNLDEFHSITGGKALVLT